MESEGLNSISNYLGCSPYSVCENGSEYLFGIVICYTMKTNINILLNCIILFATIYINIIAATVVLAQKSLQAQTEI